MLPEITKIKCPACASANIKKSGISQQKLQTRQKYFCNSCNKTFSLAAIKNKTYPIHILLHAVSSYNLGYPQSKIQKLLAKRFRLRPSQKTISNWLKEYKSTCSYSKIREEATSIYKPEDLIFRSPLQHNQVYNFQYHKAKLQLLATSKHYNNEFTSAKKFHQPLKAYLEKIPTAKFPHHIFKIPEHKSQQRASQLRFPHLKINQRTITNQANQLASLALNLAKTNTERHQAIQNFMLINDSTTIAVELPVYLTKYDLWYYARILQSATARELLKLQTPLTGHIDILQIRNNLIHILDYKPEARRIQPIHQLTMYALALASKTKLDLKSIKCAWFDEQNYYEFFPLHVIYEKQKQDKGKQE